MRKQLLNYINMKKYRDSVKIAELINKHFKGNISKEEQVLLDVFLKDNVSFIKSLREESNISDKLDNYKLYNKDKCWNNVVKATQKRKRIYLLQISQYAAAILLPILFIAAFLLITENKTFENQDVSEIVRVPNKTILEVSSGEKIILDDSLKNSQLLKLGAVKEDGRRLSYSDSKRKDTIKEIKYHTVKVPQGGEYNLKLSDGTSIWLYSESELKYPAVFTGKKRKVYLSGEAYFEVSHDPSHPFVVKTKELNVNVLGTSFNVMAYDDRDVVETSLVEGKVSVKNNVLLPSNQLVFNKETGKTKVHKVDVNKYLERRNGYFVFENETLDCILRDLSRWYDFEFFYQNKEIGEKLFGFKLQKYDNIDSILKLLEETKEVKFRIKGKSIIVQSTK